MEALLTTVGDTSPILILTLASLASVPVLDCFRDHLGCFQHLNLFLGRVTKGRPCRIWRGGP